MSHGKIWETTGSRGNSCFLGFKYPEIWILRFSLHAPVDLFPTPPVFCHLPVIPLSFDYTRRCATLYYFVYGNCRTCLLDVILKLTRLIEVADVTLGKVKLHFGFVELLLFHSQPGYTYSECTLLRSRYTTNEKLAASKLIIGLTNNTFAGLPVRRNVSTNCRTAK